MTPQAILTATECSVCAPSSLADMLEIGLLQTILTNLGASMTQADIMAGAACYVCLGLSLAESVRMVLLNQIANSLAGGTGTTSGFAGVGSPEGVVTAPTGSTYVDTGNNAFYVKVSGVGNTGWQAIVV